jgi:hypothetical protein
MDYDALLQHAIEQLTDKTRPRNDHQLAQRLHIPIEEVRRVAEKDT